MNFNQLKKKIRECNNRIAGINKQLKDLEQLDTEVRNVTPAQLDAFCKEVNITLQTLDFRNKTGLIRELVDKVIIYGQQKVEIWGHLPLIAERLGYELENRHRRPTKRGKVHTV